MTTTIEQNEFGEDVLVTELPGGWIVRELLRPAPLQQPTPSISPRQIRQALTAAGLRSAVESAVAAGDQDLKDWWEYATTFERDHPKVLAMAQALGVNDAQLDALWAAGAAL